MTVQCFIFPTDKKKGSRTTPLPFPNFAFRHFAFRYFARRIAMRLYIRQTHCDASLRFRYFTIPQVRAENFPHLLVTIMFRFIRPVSINAEVLGLLGGEPG